MSASIVAVDLDLLEAAECEHRAAVDPLATAEAELESVRQRIACYDAQHQVEAASGGDDAA